MIEQMIATVQLYIHHVKNVEVNIIIRDNRDVMLLTSAYNVARQWMVNNEFKQI